MRWLGRHRRRDPQVLDDEEDFLLVTWDSCRYDAYLEAPTPRLDAFGTARRAWAMGTYTLPSHQSMLYGFLPHVFADEPLYNRHRQQLWRISHGNVQARALVTFPAGTGNIVSGLRRRGYFTVAVAAMDWFRDAAELRAGFARFSVTGIAARDQNRILSREVERQAARRPCFAFVNYGETHSPFRYAGMRDGHADVDERFSLGRLFNQPGVLEPEWRFDAEAYQRQVACASYLDARTGELIDFFQARGRPTTVVVCSDHGECFGENGLYGHAFHHERVMEVPLLIFRLNAPAHAAPIP
jgi:membrane-anchored protein YejM (alkaline phosphatase superfamily)